MEQPGNREKVVLATADAATLKTASELMVRESYTLLGCTTLRSARACLAASGPELAVVDYHLPEGGARQILEMAKRVNPNMKCIVLAEPASFGLAAGATGGLAEHVVTKPLQPALLQAFLEVCRKSLLKRRRELARGITNSRYERNPFAGTSGAMQRLSEEAHKAVHTDRPILIQGETGTGKGVLAEWLHQNGPRCDGALVDLNCAGLSKDLLESELFGYEKGAFTGASGSKPGLVEIAHRGILFLDEVGEMDLMVQPKLLKVLEGHCYRRLGDVRERKADIQVIAATNRNLQQLVREGRFREDLYYRINTFHLTIPPLRERAEDIPVIARALLERLAKDLAREQQSLSPTAELALKRYLWPGNIRELRNVLERLALTCDARVIQEEDLGLRQRPAAPTLAAADGGMAMTLEELERQYITRVLIEESGRVTQAAARLGIPRSTLYQKIRVYGISTESH